MAKAKTTPRDNTGKFTVQKSAPAKGGKNTPQGTTGFVKKKPAAPVTDVQPIGKPAEKTVPLSDYQKVVEELHAATANKVSIKTELSKWKDRAISAEHKVSDLGDQIGEKEKKAGTWVTKHWWASGAIVLLILGAVVWSQGVHIGKETTIVQPYKDTIQQLRNDVDFWRTGHNSDSMQANEGRIPIDTATQHANFKGAKRK
jgi:hypothetical protein